MLLHVEPLEFGVNHVVEAPAAAAASTAVDSRTTQLAVTHP
jgi:hypothetical protein